MASCLLAIAAMCNAEECRPMITKNATLIGALLALIMKKKAGRLDPEVPPRFPLKSAEPAP